jgi:ankyrin repeat protein
VTWALLHHNDALAAGLLRGASRIAVEDCGAVYYASIDDSVQTLKELIARNANYAAATGVGRMTPLIAAASFGSARTVALLLDTKAAQPNEATSVAIEMLGGHGPPVPASTGGTTALMAAARNNHVAVMEVLLSHGADSAARDINGQTALDYARLGSAKDAITLLKAPRGR